MKMVIKNSNYNIMDDEDFGRIPQNSIRTNLTTENLDWKGEFFDYDNMVLINTIADGSCFFHAVIQSFYQPYIQGYYSDKSHPLDRRSFVRNFRKELSETLDTSITFIGNDDITWYDHLSRGNLKENSKDIEEYSLESMKKELDSDEPVNNLYLEFISELLELDIYIIDGENYKPYITGHDDDIL